MAQEPQSGLKRFLLVGWDAADWKIIDPLLAAGEMPHLARVIAEGVRGNHATLYPALSPMLWTSIATGKRPGKHGIHGFVEPAEDGLSVRPISNLGRKTKAFWNILNQQGKRCVVVGWWPSHPAEPLSGAMVSNHFPFRPEQNPMMPLPPDAVWPRDEAGALAEMRVHPTELTGDVLRLFVPDWQRIDQKKDRSLHDLAGIIAETMSIHCAATDLMERVEWDVAAVYYSGIDHFSHRFMRFHAGKGHTQEGDEAEWYRGIVANAYRYHDVMLGRLLALAGPDCGVMVISDHGFHSDALLPDYVPPEAAGPAVEHRDYGIFCLRAPGVKRGARVYGASLLDVTPTLLHLFGLPSGADMDGHVLINAFEDERMLEPVASWDEIAGNDGRHPVSRHYDGESAAESLKQLVALGYVAPPGEDAGRTVAETVRENRYNLARAYMDEGRTDLAMPLLRGLVAEDGEDARYHQHLFYCCLQASDRKRARQALEAFDRASVAAAARARTELTRRIEARKSEELDGGRDPKDKREIHERRVLAQKAAGYVVERLLLRIRLELAGVRTRARKQEIRVLLEEIARSGGDRNLQLALFLAEGFGAVGDAERGLRYTRRLLKADPEHAQALALEARLHQSAGRHEQAVERAVDSLALVYLQPGLHCTLARSLAALKEWGRAEEAYRIALAQAPGLIKAHEGLARLARRDPARLGEASLHMARAEAARERGKKKAEAAERGVEPVGLPGIESAPAMPPGPRGNAVTIVAGLPRSGTSMMMQMLAAGGVEAFTDGRREADEDNPRGYLEHEKATALHRDAAWVPQARGKAVKIVAHLLPYLPAGEEYRIVFMHRALEEVTASQTAMLRRLGRKGGELAEAEMARVFAGQLVRVQEWLKRAPGVHVLTMQYGQVLADPAAASRKLAEFLGGGFDAAAAEKAVEAGLRRQGR